MSSAVLPVLTVNQAIEVCNTLFAESTFAVEGEVANYAVSRGKFIFFDLKDETVDAKLACFAMVYQQTIPLEDGMRVVVYGRPGIHTRSGQFRLTVQRVEAKGEGSLKRAFELLKAKLDQEGLFSPARKRPLPRFPRRVGLISSREAAGYGDFLRIAGNRLPGVQFLFIHVAVQGQDAEREISQAFQQLNQLDLDVIVLVRGGGSMEDLHAFNSETMARSIVASKAPVLVGVGHERDVTIADFCADVRAATPSNAAELLVPTREEVEAAVHRQVLSGKNRLQRLTGQYRERVQSTRRQVATRLRYRLAEQRSQVGYLSKAIDRLSPQRTLERGYSITVADGARVRSVRQLALGAHITTYLADGSLTSQINHIDTALHEEI